MTRETQVEKTAHTKTQDGKNLIHMKNIKTASIPEAQWQMYKVGFPLNCNEKLSKRFRQESNMIPFRL